MLTAPSDVGAATPGGVALVAATTSTVPLATDSRPVNYDVSNAAYAELRKSVLDAGLMDRRYDYYLLRFVTAFGLFAGALALLFVLPPGWGWTVLAAVVLGFTTTQLGIIGHDSGHMAVFQKERFNFLLGQFCLSFILGVSFWAWRDRHNRHHVLTNDEEEDPDLELGGIFTLNAAEAASQRGLRRWVTRYQAFLVVPVVTLTLDWAFRIDGWRHAIMELRGARRAVELGVLLLSHAAWATPALFLGWRWLAIYVGAQWVGNLYLGMSFAPNHKGMPTWAHGTHLTFLERQVLSSCNIRPGRVTDYLFCGLNYQIEHHLFPTMPRVNFCRVRTMVIRFCAEHGLPYEELSVLGAYRQAIGELHRCGQATQAID
jgi:fatty acid desaturase